MNAEELHAKLYPEAASKKEYILCAAMYYDDGIHHKGQPSGTITGFIIPGYRHDHAISIEYYLIQIWHQNKIPAKAGFLTSKGRFVDRKEGGQIAYDAGQISKPTDCLTSEHLY